MPQENPIPANIALQIKDEIARSRTAVIGITTLVVTLLTAIASGSTYQFLSAHIDKSIKESLTTTGAEKAHQHLKNIRDEAKALRQQAQESVNKIAQLEDEASSKGLCVPYGAIIAFNGSVADLDILLKSGWRPCDGSNGTPDLRDKFIVGARTPYDVGNTGGSNTHNHAATSSTPTGNGKTSGFGGSNSSNDNHEHKISVKQTSHKPPYYTVIYLLRTRQD